MKVSVLASGSKGNTTYIGTEHAHILVDLGTSSSYAEKKLKELDVDPKEICGIILTHTHTDHIEGLRVFIKKYHPTIYLTEKMYREIEDKLILPDYYILTEDFQIEDLMIEIFKTSHDVAESNGYIFQHQDHSLVYITDTGYIPMKLYPKLKNKTIYIVESNHDIELLMNGSYPYYLKQRILGDRGHLSNRDCAYLLSKVIGDATREVVLIHLSEENNDPSVAYETVVTTLQEHEIKVSKVIVSSQTEKTEMIEV